MGKNKTLTSFVFRFLRPHKFAYTILLLCTFSLALDNTVWPYILRVVVDILDNFDLKRGEALSALKVPLLAGVLLWLLIDIGFRLQGFLIAYMIPKLEANIRVTLFEEVLTHSPKYFSEQLPGKLANKISDMTTHISLALRQNYYNQYLSLFLNSFQQIRVKQLILVL